MDQQFLDQLKKDILSQYSSRNKFAEAAGIGSSTISMVMTGKKPIGIKIGRKMAKALHVPEDQFLRDAGVLSTSLDDLAIQNPTFMQIMSIVRDFPDEELECLLDYVLWRQQMISRGANKLKGK